MFKERILFVGGVMLAIGGIFGLGSLIYWFVEAFNIHEKTNYALINLPAWIPLAIMGLIISYFLYKLVYWLMIEPYLNYRRNKRGQRKHT